MKIYKAKIKGVTPLMHNRFPEASSGTSKKRSTKAFNPVENAKKCLYRNTNTKIYQPADHLEGALIKSAVDFKFSGRKTYKDTVAREVIVEPQQIPFSVPSDPENYEVDVRSAVIPSTRGRIWVARPTWSPWELEFYVKVFADDQLDGETLKNILENAGRKVHIGTYRAKFGRFEVVDFDEVTEKAFEAGLKKMVKKLK